MPQGCLGLQRPEKSQCRWTGPDLSPKFGPPRKADLAHPGDPGHKQFSEEVILHGYLREEEVDLVIVTGGATRVLSHHVRKHKAGLCGKKRKLHHLIIVVPQNLLSPVCVYASHAMCKTADLSSGKNLIFSSYSNAICSIHYPCHFTTTQNKYNAHFQSLRFNQVITEICTYIWMFQ